jgi:D-alanyl-D-alanine carboxypeptidase (penicillin-binding protein 5/6)
LHGLMLPSGNDAAIALAEYFGRELDDLRRRKKGKSMQLFEKKLSKDKGVSGSTLSAQSDDGNMSEKYVKYFVGEMNKVAKSLKLVKTTYTNPHGLSDKGNKSTAEDQAKLAAIIMRDPLIKGVVGKQAHECHPKYRPQSSAITRSSTENVSENSRDEDQHSGIGSSE